MAYSSVADLLIGDLLISPTVNKATFVNEAANEMDMRLGWIYDLPIVPLSGGTSWTSLPAHEVLLLKSINNRLATGRLIMTLAIPGEENRLHAYGQSLVREALNDLFILVNDDTQVRLSAKRKDLSAGELPLDARTPGILNHDEESLLLAFENTVMRHEHWWSRPGRVT